MALRAAATGNVKVRGSGSRQAQANEVERYLSRHEEQHRAQRSCSSGQVLEAEGTGRQRVICGRNNTGLFNQRHAGTPGQTRPKPRQPAERSPMKPETPATYRLPNPIMKGQASRPPRPSPP